MTVIQTAREVPDLGRLARTIKHKAEADVWDGRLMTPYFKRCRTVLRQLGAVVLFTRDVGYHSSGWWKNPDYERCYHLSLSFFDPESGEPRPRDATLTALLIDALFGRAKRWLWCEPPYSEDGQTRDVWHYRLFCDPAWEPIKPRGEVYSRELTEAGWRSFSDVQADLADSDSASDSRANGEDGG